MRIGLFDVAFEPRTFGSEITGAAVQLDLDAAVGLTRVNRAGNGVLQSRQSGILLNDVHDTGKNRHVILFWGDPVRKIPVRPSGFSYTAATGEEAAHARTV